VLCSKLVKYRGPRGRFVAKDAAAGTPGELIDDFTGKALRVGRERRLEHEAANLPVPRRAVLSRAGRLADAVRRTRGRHCGDTGQRCATPESEGLQHGKPETAGCTGYIAEGIAPAVAIRLRIMCLTYANSIENDDSSAAHQFFGMVCT
jgi:hypothetical protein